MRRRFPFLTPWQVWLEIQTSEAMPEEEGRRAGDMVGKGTSTMELLYGSLSGMAFGLVSPIAGQPFDIVKTKMQADARFLKSSPFSVVKTVVATEGVRGMYRGMLPILASTGVQKTVLFTANAGDQRALTCTLQPVTVRTQAASRPYYLAYPGARRAVEKSGMPLLTEAIPGTGGLKPGQPSSWRSPSPSRNPDLKASPSPSHIPGPDPDPLSSRQRGPIRPP